MTSPFFLICLCFRNDSLLKCKVLIFKRYDYYIFLCLPKVFSHTKWCSSFPKERADTEVFGKLFNTLFWVLQMINLVWVLKQYLLLTAWPLATPFVSISACSAKKRIQNLLIIFPIETVKYHKFAKNAEIIRRSSWKASPSWWRGALGVEHRVHQPSSENGQLSRPNPYCIFAFLDTSQVAKRNPNLIYTEFFMRLWVLKLDFGGFQVASCGSFLSSVTKGFALGRGYWLSRGGTKCLLICSKASQGPTFPEFLMNTPLWAGQCL